MKNFILTSAFLILGASVYSQSFMDNGVATAEVASVLFSKTPTAVKQSDCIGEWSSSDGTHLTLYANNKATWKDDGHIYYMHWNSEYSSDHGNIKINLTGNDHCKHQTLVLSRTESGLEVVEEQTNIRLYIGKELTATLQ